MIRRFWNFTFTTDENVTVVKGYGTEYTTPCKNTDILSTHCQARTLPLLDVNIPYKVIFAFHISHIFKMKNDLQTILEEVICASKIYCQDMNITVKGRNRSFLARADFLKWLCSIKFFYAAYVCALFCSFINFTLWLWNL